MNTKQKIRLNMYLTVKKVANANEKIVNSIPKMPATLAVLQGTIAEIQSIAELQGVNKTGLALDKKNLRKRLIDLTISNANKIVILAKGNNNETLLKEVRLNDWDLTPLAAVTLKDKAQLVYDRAEANMANLAEQGITADTQKVFLETIIAFNDAIAMPRTGITEKSQATQKLLVLFGQGESILDSMDLLVRSVKNEYPDFYNIYKSARKLVDTSSGSLALRGTVTEAGSGNPVKGAQFSFKAEQTMNSSGNGTGDIVKKTSEKGIFHLKSIEPGNYKVMITREGYKSAEVALTVTQGERAEVNVELEKA